MALVACPPPSPLLTSRPPPPLFPPGLPPPPTLPPPSPPPPPRCNVTDLLSGLETVVSVLLDHGLALEALPVISLWEYVAHYVTRQLHSVLLCRLQRVEALCQLGLMAEACGVLLGLLGGLGLADPVMDTDFVVKAEDGSVLQVGGGEGASCLLHVLQVGGGEGGPRVCSMCCK